jgi:hypothetical protein
MLKIKLPLAFGLCVAGFVGSSAVSVPASACGGEWIPALDDVDYRPAGVSEAEKKLESGKLAGAAGNVIRMMPHIKQLTVKSPGTTTGRAQRVLAVAIARSGGALPVAREVPDWIQEGWLGKTATERKSNLEWSVKVLRKLSTDKAHEPNIESQLGEALAVLDGGQTEAREILERLAKADVITSPEAYVVLAKLRAAAGDSNGEKIAMARCQAMSSGSNRCEVSSQG